MFGVPRNADIVEFHLGRLQDAGEIVQELYRNRDEGIISRDEFKISSAKAAKEASTSLDALRGRNPDWNILIAAPSMVNMDDLSNPTFFYTSDEPVLVNSTLVGITVREWGARRQGEVERKIYRGLWIVGAVLDPPLYIFDSKICLPLPGSRPLNVEPIDNPN